jgi:hypothetical protein
VARLGGAWEPPTGDGRKEGGDGGIGVKARAGGGDRGEGAGPVNARRW